jgi:hypothetical protein
VVLYHLTSVLFYLRHNKPFTKDNYEIFIFGTVKVTNKPVNLLRLLDKMTKYDWLILLYISLVCCNIVDLNTSEQFPEVELKDAAHERFEEWVKENGVVSILRIKQDQEYSTVALRDIQVRNVH